MTGLLYKTVPTLDRQRWPELLLAYWKPLKLRWGSSSNGSGIDAKHRLSLLPPIQSRWGSPLLTAEASLSRIWWF
ncbi:hypothetical protein HanIR_Chr05g0238581 [Helianthus annuus]|nr:hypothetical protein HanIR_Chr05g0238581 [Helianthus annuus]